MRNSKYNSSSVFNKKKLLALLTAIYCQRPLEVIKHLVCSLNWGKKQLLNSLKKHLSHFGVNNALCIILCENKLLANRSFLFSANCYRNTTFSLIFYIFPSLLFYAIRQIMPLFLSPQLTGAFFSQTPRTFVPRKQLWLCPVTSFWNTKTEVSLLPLTSQHLRGIFYCTITRLEIH